MTRREYHVQTRMKEKSTVTPKAVKGQCCEAAITMQTPSAGKTSAYLLEYKISLSLATFFSFSHQICASNLEALAFGSRCHSVDYWQLDVKEPLSLWRNLHGVNLPVDRSQNNQCLGSLSSPWVSSVEGATEDVIFQGFAKARRAMRFEQNHDLSTYISKFS